jgi:hypothetical protein
MKTYEGLDVQIHVSLTLVLVEGERSPSRSGRIASGSLGQDAGWAPEQVWMTWKRENPLLYRDSNSEPSVVQSVGSRYADNAIPASRLY